MNKDGATLFFGFLNKANGSSNNILLDDVLYIIFGPFIGQKVDSIELTGVFGMFPGTVDYMCDLIHLKPFHILYWLRDKILVKLVNLP